MNSKTRTTDIAGLVCIDPGRRFEVIDTKTGATIVLAHPDPLRPLYTVAAYTLSDSAVEFLDQFHIEGDAETSAKEAALALIETYERRTSRRIFTADFSVIENGQEPRFIPFHPWRSRHTVAQEHLRDVERKQREEA